MQRSGTIALALGLANAACTATLDVGSTGPLGLLPVDERNPMVLVNDGANDNWQGEYAVLLANGGGPPLAGIVVDASCAWPDIDVNIAGWRDLVAAARSSGLQDLPDPIASIGAPLVRPRNGDISTTQPNRSEGARFIIEASKRLALPHRPLVVVTGGALTDVADAYLMDPTTTERVVVVSSLGNVTGTGGDMRAPNGEMDPWADTIVAAKFAYVQVSAFYDQGTDIPEGNLAQLPDNPLGARIAAKQPDIWKWPPASDQVGVIAVGIPNFVTTVDRVLAAKASDAEATAGPDLIPDAAGASSGWLVTASNSAVATTRLWQLLLEARPASP